MKKIISLVSALLICGAIFTGCNTAEKPAETETASETTTVSETTTASETTTVSETEAETEATAAVALDKFAEAYANLADGKDVSVKDSKTFAFAQEFKDTTSIYMNMTVSTAETGTVTTKMAMKDGSIAMIMEGDGVAGSIYIVDMTYTVYDPSSMSAMKMTLDQTSYDAMGLNNIFEQMNIDIEGIETETAVVKSYEAEVDGETYTYEIMEGEGYYYVYNKDGKMYTCGTTDGSSSSTTIVINEISSDVPADIFVQPEGYTIMDMDAMLSTDTSVAE